MKESILGIIRHAATTYGGFLVANGIVDSGQFETLVGALVVVAGIVWSVVEKRLRK